MSEEWVRGDLLMLTPKHRVAVDDFPRYSFPTRTWVVFLGMDDGYMIVLTPALMPNTWRQFEIRPDNYEIELL